MDNVPGDSTPTELNFSSSEELISFFDQAENPFKKEKQIKEFRYSSLLKPIDYLLAKKRLEEDNLNLKKEDFENLQYFDLRIEIEDFNQEFIKYSLESPEQYEDRINYCAFQMQKDIFLVDGKDTLNCILFHYERTFNLAPFGHFTLAFDKSKNSNALKTLVFHDHLFNNGIIKFAFQPKNIVIGKSLI